MGQTESCVPMRETFCPLAVLCLKSNTGPGVMASTLRNIARGRTTRKRALLSAAGARWSRNKKPRPKPGRKSWEDYHLVT